MSITTTTTTTAQVPSEKLAALLRLIDRAHAAVMGANAAEPYSDAKYSAASERLNAFLLALTGDHDLADTLRDALFDSAGSLPGKVQHGLTASVVADMASNDAAELRFERDQWLEEHNAGRHAHPTRFYGAEDRAYWDRECGTCARDAADAAAMVARLEAQGQIKPTPAAGRALITEAPGAEICAVDFATRAAEHYAAGEISKWASCLRLAGEFATDAWHVTRNG